MDELAYQLLDNNGNVVYYGITSRTALDRLSEHESVKIFAEGLSHDNARPMEGALMRNRINERLTSDQMKSLSIKDQLAAAGLLNVNRGRTDDRWAVDEQKKSTDPLIDLVDKIHDKPKRVKKRY